MRIPGARQLTQAARWLRSRTGRGALIIAYHRIAAARSDPYGLCVPPERFAAHMAIVRRHAHPLSLDELVCGLRAGDLPRRAVAVTIDDGYADVLYAASPVLAQYEIPATVFVTTGSPGRSFWWDELAQIVMLPPRLPGELFLNVDGVPLRWKHPEAAKASKNTSPAHRLGLLTMLHARLVAIPEQRAVVLSQLKEWVGLANGETDDGVRALTVEELRELGKNELVEIGAHTVSHSALDRLPEECQRREIEQSKLHLERSLQRKVESFSYPHGRGTSTTRLLLYDLGFNVACSSLGDVVRAGCDPLAFPRFWIKDWSQEAFAAWLQRWLVR